MSPRSFAMVIALTLLLQGWACQTAQRPSSAPTSDASGLLFKRVTLLVSNLERSLGIYRDILGFTLNAPVSESSPDSYSYPVFRIPKEGKIRFVSLDTKTQERTLALTEVTGIPLPKPSQPLMSAAVIRVPDLANTIQKIKALGLETTEPKIARSADGKFAFIEQAFVDYDGHLIVLYQLLP
ncbi:MAG: VOC family protein [Saprospiraceae bacterium]|nr:VOC family protein [Saprospiraceae bacterium]MDW8483255.1 VOC family protein [Saprospiraceae bacterium]